MQYNVAVVPVCAPFLSSVAGSLLTVQYADESVGAHLCCRLAANSHLLLLPTARSLN